MPRLNFDIDEADLLKAYKVDTLTPKWVQMKSFYFAILNTPEQVNGKKSIMTLKIPWLVRCSVRQVELTWRATLWGLDIPSSSVFILFLFVYLFIIRVRIREMDMETSA